MNFKYGIIAILLVISITAVTFLVYKDNLENRLYCNRIFVPFPESFLDYYKDNTNEKFYSWESEMLDCDHGTSYIKTTLSFVNDSTAIIYIKSASNNPRSFNFSLRYFFNQIVYSSKEYHIYKVKNDTLYRFINTREEAFKELTIPYYIKKNSDLVNIEIPPRIFKPYKEYAAYKLDDGKLYLPYFSIEYFGKPSYPEKKDVKGYLW